MSERLQVVVSVLAAEQIRAADDWWHINRSKAPDAFREDLERATSLLSIQPHLGLVRATRPSKVYVAFT